nr:PREDICTED: uncharacterized protein LOC105663970 [Megachile rotundata]
MHCFQTSQPFSKSSVLRSLNVYIDTVGLIRVGGRLQKSALSENAKHPIVIASHPLVKLIILSVHLRTLHGGLQLTLSTLRQEFWLCRARPLIRSVLYRCIMYARERAAPANELMESLPSPRVNRAERAFQHCGIDYAGPVLVRSTAGRGFKSRKAYIALFICLFWFGFQMVFDEERLGTEVGQ